MKKIIIMFLAVLMTMSLIACGKTEPVMENDSTDATVNTTDDNSTVVEESNENDATDETVEDTVEVPEEPVLTEEEIKAQKIEAGMEKVDRLLKAYDYLVNGTVYDRAIQSNIEYLDGAMGGDELQNYITKDGLNPNDIIETQRGIWAVGIIYYDAVVNGGNEPYDLAEWTVKQESDEAIINYIPEKEAYIEATDTNDVYMLEAIGLCPYLKAIRLCPYLKSVNEIKANYLFETDAYTITGITSSYGIILDCDGKLDLVAVFDEEGNMLNICTPNDEWNSDSWVYTWY